MRTSVAGLAALAVLVSCERGADKAGGGATVPTTARATTTVTTDPYAVPAVIDVAYVNRILGALDAAYGDIVRLVVRSRAISQDAKDRLASLFEGEFLDIRVKGFENDLDQNFEGYQAEPGNQKTDVVQLITATPSCLFAQVHRDYSLVATEPDSRLSNVWVALKRSPTVATDRNVTPWIVIYDGFNRDLSAPGDPCAGS